MGEGSEQKAHVVLGVMGPSRQHVHVSRLRCCDFSCRAQSYFVAKVAESQKVH